MKRNITIFILFLIALVTTISFQNFSVTDMAPGKILESGKKLTDVSPCLNEEVIFQLPDSTISKLNYQNRLYVTTKNGLYISQKPDADSGFCLKTSKNGLLRNMAEHMTIDPDGRIVLSHSLNMLDKNDKSSGISISTDGGFSFKNVNFLKVPAIGDVSGYVFESNFEESKDATDPLIYVAGGKGIFKFNTKGKYLGTVLCQLSPTSSCVWNPEAISAGQQVLFKSVRSINYTKKIIIETSEGDQTYSVLPDGNLMSE